MADQIRVNGNLHSWGSIVLKIDGERFYGITSISYEDKRERVHGHGMGRHQGPRGRSRGKYTTEPGKIGGFKGTMRELREKLALQSRTGTSYGEVEFEATIEFMEDDETPILEELGRCVLVGVATSHEEGADPLKEEMSINYMSVRRNGFVLFDDSEGTP